jgi:hypothetical protein
METAPKGAYRRLGRDEEVLTTECWCRWSVVRVPADEVRRRMTRTCGRALCTALDWHHALTGDGQPCGCDEREPG